jgi:hypothetical protein
MSATDLWFLADKLVHYRSTFARKTADSISGPSLTTSKPWNG